jgi:hypothetical protein
MESIFPPPITQIDADYISEGPDLNLRYLRHLHAGLARWVAIRNPKSEIRNFTARVVGIPNS